MEQTQHSTSKKSSELYQLAKKITQASSDSEKEVLFEKLEDMVSNIFKNDKFDEIESALTIAVENEEPEVMGIIMDDAELEVGHIQFEHLGVEKVSSMLLVSCMMISKESDVIIPSIGDFQRVMQKHLLKAGYITEANQFRLGAVRIDNDSLEDLDMTEWWKIHRNIVAELDTPENEAKLEVISEAEVEPGINMFHLVATIVGQEDDNILEAMFNLDRTQDVWHEVGKELSTELVGFNIIPPDFVSGAISHSQYILQTSQLQLMLQSYKEYNNIDLAYIQTDEEGTYVVMIIDNEDNTLADFYVFETDGNETDFISMLIDEAETFPSGNIWHFDVAVDDIDAWYEEDVVYLDDLMKHAHEIDIKQYKQFMQPGSSKYLH